MTVKGENKVKIKQLSEWEMAMRAAQRQIDEAQLRIGQLKQSVRIFRKKIAAGEPWPGAATQERERGRLKNSAGTSAESVPAEVG